MNTLAYVNINYVQPNVEDGTVIVAPAAIVEARGTNATCAEAETIAQSIDWKRVHGDGTYHYELLVARRGTTIVRDVDGEPCGMRVNGTNRGRW